MVQTIRLLNHFRPWVHLHGFSCRSGVRHSIILFAIRMNKSFSFWNFLYIFRFVDTCSEASETSVRLLSTNIRTLSLIFLHINWLRNKLVSKSDYVHNIRFMVVHIVLFAYKLVLLWVDKYENQCWRPCMYCMTKVSFWSF